MDQVPQLLKSMLPCRNNQIDKLYYLFCHKEEPYVENVFVYGRPCTGKSTAVRSVLEQLEVKHCVVNLMECYTQRILFESILNDLQDQMMDSKKPLPIVKCEIIMDFISSLQNNFPKKGCDNFVIVLDKAEELRNMSSNLLGIFLKLRELTALPVTVIFISEICFESYSYHTCISIKIFFPQYTNKEIMHVLAMDEDKIRDIIRNHYKKEVDFSTEFYQNYLSIFLSIFYRTTRSFKELRRMCRINFLKYLEPVVNGIYKAEDSMALWRHISPILKNSLEVLHVMLEVENKPQIKTQDIVAIMELPFYAKYLLIASYLASYNSPKEDKRLFMKYQHKRQRSKTQKQMMKRHEKQLNMQLGPAAFTFDRLLAIFYSLLDQKVGFNNNILVQVSSLVELKFLSAVLDTCSIDAQKYKCNVSYEVIQDISRIVGINIRKYLYDF